MEVNKIKMSGKRYEELSVKNKKVTLCVTFLWELTITLTKDKHNKSQRQTFNG
jgi:hypothetical protein